MIYTVIAKPTKSCNADCDYCSSPPDHEDTWSISTFKTIWDRLLPQMADEAYWIWHGGEPMLLDPDFYREALDIARADRPNVKFSIQTNLLLYKTKRWKSVFEEVFEGRISSSFDPDEKHRTIKGSTDLYSRTFYRKIDEVLNDGFVPLVIGTYSEESSDLGLDMYEKSLARGDMSFHLRFNYRYPAGRATGDGAIISAETYGKMLLQVYNKWISDVPNFSITPLDLMLKQSVSPNQKGGQCPWTSSCGGRFLGILPNGDVYNCGEFSDLDDPRFKYGNVLQGVVSGLSGSETQVVNIVRRSSDKKIASELMSSPAARLMKRRVHDLPGDCRTCRHFHACEGGCMRDAELFDRGLGGKFFYCQSWKMVFDRIKESVMTGEADKVLEKLEFSPDAARRYVSSRLEDSL